MAKWPIPITKDVVFLRRRLNDLWRAGQIISSDKVQNAVGPSGDITEEQISNWDTAFGWGDHAEAGYLTSFTETDPVFGASPAAGIAAGDITNWTTAFNRSPTSLTLSGANVLTLAREGVADLDADLSGLAEGSGLTFHQSVDETLGWFEVEA